MATSSEARAARPTVVLVHGLLRTPRSLASVARALESSGFLTQPFGYPSLRGRFESHGERLAEEFGRLDADPACVTIHVVGHSLGNLVLRAALARRLPRKLGRIVMLVPPNRGSPVARALAMLLGRVVPVLRQLSDDPESDACRLGPVSGATVGVIAARYDHLVREPSSHVDGESDHLVMATTHSFLLWRRDVHEEIVHFLGHGRFHRSE